MVPNIGRREDGRLRFEDPLEVLKNIKRPEVQARQRRAAEHLRLHNIPKALFSERDILNRDDEASSYLSVPMPDPTACASNLAILVLTSSSSSSARTPQSGEEVFSLVPFSGALSFTISR
jgi:hypothetical protein